MKKINRRMLLVGIAVLLIALISGCTSEKENKKALIMGLDDTFAPMGFRDEKGELVGFDIDLSKEIAKRIGIEIKYQPIEWSMKETELITGNIDLIWNGYSITKLRQEEVAFSKPYLANSQIIVTLSNSQVVTISDLEGLTVATQAESSALDAAKSKVGFVESVKGGKLIEFSTNNEAFNDLEAGRSDAIVVDEVLARYYMNQNSSDKYKVLEENLGPEDFAVGLRKEDKELLKQINDAFDDMRSDGTYDEIYDRWF